MQVGCIMPLSQQHPAIIGQSSRLDHAHHSAMRNAGNAGNASLARHSTAHSMGAGKSNLFFRGTTTPAPLDPTMPNSRDPNAETPSPYKNRYFVCQYSLLTSLMLPSGSFAISSRQSPLISCIFIFS
jgi:hypothetical protein